MTQSGTSLSEKKNEGRTIKGVRCQVCTGCGLCPGVPRQGLAGPIHVLTESGFGKDGISLKNEKGLRLVAADVGTTTIAMELYGEDGSVRDSHALVNPQTEFGSDVLSRVRAAREPDVRLKMQEMVRSALARGAERFLKCLEPGESLFMVIAANTVMSYLLMDWDPEELGQAPFSASKLDGADFELPITHGSGKISVPCHLLPGFSAFVGSDLYAGALACGMDESPEMTLLVDLGTNGEILLGNREGILATATAAGPAFEGGPARGTWGADLVRYAALLLEKGILDETGLLREPYFEQGVRVGNVLLTKEAIRSLQVAKAAILAGIRILMKEKGVTAGEIERVVLAGGFGYFLRPEDAVRIGLLPASLEGKAVSGGNTALAGARKYGADVLLKGKAGKPDDGAGQSERKTGKPGEGAALSNVRVINLAEQPEFPDWYVDSMQCKPWSE